MAFGERWGWGSEDKEKVVPFTVCVFFLMNSIIHFTSFLKIFFDVDHFKSLYWICYSIASVLCFGFLAHGILAPRPGIEPVPPALEGKVLITAQPGKSLPYFF